MPVARRRPLPRSVPRDAASTSTTASTSGSAAPTSTGCGRGHRPTTCTPTGRRCAQLGKDLGAKDDDFEPFARFLPDAPEVSRPDGGLIRVAYRANVVTYRYARSTNTYRRSVSVEGKQVDANDGARVEPKNVIVMVVRFAQTGDSKHRLEADLTGSGRAWISTNGRTVEGVWKKSGTTKPTRFYDRSGNRLNLTIGQTFIQVVGSARDVRFEAGTEVAPED